jgi:hypothetical protein
VAGVGFTRDGIITGFEIRILVVSVIAIILK